MPLVVVLCLAVAIFSGLVHTEESASAALARERSGLTRGDFVDRTGRPLVISGVRGTRVFRQPDLALSVGYRTPKGRWRGLEAQYNRLLSAAGARHDWRTFFLHLRGESAQGGTVHLTLDSRVQAAADAGLGSAKGAAVAIDPRTGEVLALVSKPYCSPASISTEKSYAKCTTDPSKPLMNRATQLLVPPGSAFKIATLTAAIDSGRFHLSDVFSGADAFGPNPYFDNVTYPSNITRTDLTSITLAQALAFSDNFTFAHLGLTLGSAEFLKYMLRYGLDNAIPFDLPVKASTVAGGKRTLSNGELARSSFGAEDDEVTPMQMALIAATVANGGVTMAPHLVSSLSTADGRTTWRYTDHPLRRVMSSSTAKEVTAGMKFVVTAGSGYKAQIHGMKVAGKTGTAASGASVPHAWFIAFAPADHPVVAVAVLHEFSGEGFEYAAPIARKIMIAALQERGFRVK